jgi:SAM-dependent methyltransferase
MSVSRIPDLAGHSPHPPVTPFFGHVADTLAVIDDAPTAFSTISTMKKLRQLGLGDFGHVLWNMPCERYPKLSEMLPAMSPREVTLAWTGAEGNTLLDIGLGFVRSCADKYAEIAGQSLHGKTILDFGCGYGRFLRLFNYYSDNVFGVDAWEHSLDHCRTAGYGGMVMKIDEVATTIPFGHKFDLMTAFSVFTHLSEVSTIAALKALRGAARPGAVLVITIRPVEFWRFCHVGATHLELTEAEVTQMVAAHEREGFAYYPNNSDDPDREVHYGDTSMTLEWLAAHAPGWAFRGCDRSINDQLQTYVFLQAV